MRLLPAAVLALCAFCVQGAEAKSFADLFPLAVAYGKENPDAQPVIDQLSKLEYKQGDQLLAGGVAKLSLGEDYYFLGPEDSRTVLTDLWGNPPGAPVLGMVFDAHATPIDGDSWAMILHYEDIGYVSDEDAAGYDYSALLKEMQADTRDTNTWRIENGYDPITLVGWAEPPAYDADARKLYWAKELAFGTDENHELNYNIRALGRRGVLVMNVVAGMDLLDEVHAATPALLSMTNFTDGNRYTDFDPSLDKVAAIGIGGLIAGKVAAKAGLLAGGLLILKKFGVLLLLPLLALKNRIFPRNKA